ncbi:hypothetical protein IFR04_006061 [Cadophora malorum]|uniref:Uncharacterized protein n=1 Tax=Cadophora malorum TaxID=108018 RepID=A0A8H7TJY2_9HELO|nr:hypothetical protein IFR04_006061 [Cadophora malorum]
MSPPTNANSTNSEASQPTGPRTSGRARAAPKRIFEDATSAAKENDLLSSPPSSRRAKSRKMNGKLTFNEQDSMMIAPQGDERVQRPDTLSADLGNTRSGGSGGFGNTKSTASDGFGNTKSSAVYGGGNTPSDGYIAHASEQGNSAHHSEAGDVDYMASPRTNAAEIAVDSEYEPESDFDFEEEDDEMNEDLHLGDDHVDIEPTEDVVDVPVIDVYDNCEHLDDARVTPEELDECKKVNREVFYHFFKVNKDKCIELTEGSFLALDHKERPMSRGSFFASIRTDPGRLADFFVAHMPDDAHVAYAKGKELTLQDIKAIRNSGSRERRKIVYAGALICERDPDQSNVYGGSTPRADGARRMKTHFEQIQSSARRRQVNALYTAARIDGVETNFRVLFALEPETPEFYLIWAEGLLVIPYLNSYQFQGSYNQWHNQASYDWVMELRARHPGKDNFPNLGNFKDIIQRPVSYVKNKAEAGNAA